MKRWCAYHKQNFGTDKFMGEIDGQGVEGDTHGICPECLEIELRKLEEYKKSEKPRYIHPGIRHKLHYDPDDPRLCTTDD